MTIYAPSWHAYLSSDHGFYYRATISEYSGSFIQHHWLCLHHHADRDAAIACGKSAMDELVLPGTFSLDRFL